MNSNTMSIAKRIAIIAHESKKTELIEWSYYNRDLLNQHEVIATGAAGNILEGTLNQPVVKLPSGPIGGDQQLVGMIYEGRIDIIIFLNGPSNTHPDDSDVDLLLTTAIHANIIIAGNSKTADYVLTSAMLNRSTTNEPYQAYVNKSAI